MNAETVVHAAAVKETTYTIDGKTKATPVISPDARFVAGTIVKHMWIIFVLLPLVIYVLVSALK